MTSSEVATMRRLRLEQLQRLCEDGKRAELQSTIATYSTKELRTLCGGFGVPAQSKEYAAYQSKAGYSELLVKLLEAKAASSTGLTEFVPINATPSGRTRKTKNCTLRLINVLFSTAMGPFLADLMDDVWRRKRTAEGASPLWEKVRTEFLSSKAEYARIRYPDDHVFADFNLASPVAHSSEKLHKMWEKLGLAYVSVFSQFSVEDNIVSDLSVCAGRTDVYYLRRWLNDKPELLSTVCKPAREMDVMIAPQSVSHNGHQNAQSLLQIVQQNAQQSLQSSLEHVATPAMEPTTGAHVLSTDDEGEQLMQSIKLAYDVLAVMPVSDRGSEIEHTVRRRLNRCAKRLKTLEDELDKR
ncbi:hypothetical protein PC129_g9513 [Phytophthora cactorum]|uniref:Uncharacterized protein n=1 Tax=Phytophthora cactorum TaxID=29920 RepID=A0A329SLN1_9STRA|nr:hypothetical protein Pcac1_g5814 [Phytophthora cactorum]KAG2823553.1 hypothetical protein PC112_g10464 [Phytophthora cactorum]KAG2826049.1 hypothetical protein PC111_g9131 [Phytophthora cactorum]KAG2857387.1 hypothetical protein PC113_g10737 [Phytophthora cactorum]KAG2906013.1 hypothetical protein PC114_g11325 [Phytophthora cactorum]